MNGAAGAPKAAAANVLLSAALVAARKGMKARTVRNWCETGIVRAHRRGRRDWLIPWPLVFRDEAAAAAAAEKQGFPLHRKPRRPRKPNRPKMPLKPRETTYQVTVSQSG